MVKRDETGGTALWKRQFGSEDLNTASRVAEVSSEGIFLAGNTDSAKLNGKTDNGGFGGFVAKLDWKYEHSG